MGIFTLAIPPHRTAPTVSAECWDKQDFINQMLQDRWRHETLTLPELLAREVNDEEAREAVPEAFALFDAGHTSIVEYTDGGADLEYASVDEAPTAYEIACDSWRDSSKWGFPMLGLYVFGSLEEAERFVDTYNGPRKHCATTTLRACIQRERRFAAH